MEGPEIKRKCENGRLHISKLRRFRHTNSLRTIKEETKIFRFMNSSGYKRKKVWCAQNRALEEQSRALVVDIWRRGVFHIDFISREKNLQIQCAFNAVGPPSKPTHIVFIEWSLYLFKKRYS